MKLDVTALRARLETHSVTVACEVNGTCCRLWYGNSTSTSGRGQLGIRDAGKHKKLYVHRLAYLLNKKRKRSHGIIEVDTLPRARQICGNRLCIEPSHLEGVKNV